MWHFKMSLIQPIEAIFLPLSSQGRLNIKTRVNIFWTYSTGDECLLCYFYAFSKAWVKNRYASVDSAVRNEIVVKGGGPHT